MAYEKLCLKKEYLSSLSPSSTNYVADRFLDSYIAWLASRYNRPALPTAFNDRLRHVDPRDKRRRHAKSGNSTLSGLYIEVIPDEEIAEDEVYNVNLLGLLPVEHKDEISKAEEDVNRYADIMRKAKMNVSVAVRTEDSVSVATIKRFKRFYYDDLSYRDEAPLPPETKGRL